MIPYGSNIQPITYPRSPARTQNPIIPTPAVRPPTAPFIPTVAVGVRPPIVQPQIGYLDLTPQLTNIPRYPSPPPNSMAGMINMERRVRESERQERLKPDLNRKRPRYIAKEFRFVSNQHLYKLRDNNLLTDITLIVGNETMRAHKFILFTASEYFERKIHGGFTPIGDTLVIQDVSPVIFKLYLDLIYGKGLILNDWHVAFELFKYLDYTQTYWSTKDTDVIECVSVPEDDFIDYIGALAELYQGEVPNDVIRASAFHLLKVIDLSPLGPDFLEVFLDSKLLTDITSEQIRKVDLEKVLIYA